MTDVFRLDALGLDDALLLGTAPEVAGAIAISELAVDSRAAGAGALFAALPGVQRHGADFAPQAFAAGAAAAMTDLEGALRIRAALGAWPAPILVVDDPRRRLARLSAKIYAGQPETVLAVTGTNGKTSVAHFAAELLAALGRPAAHLGTTGVRARGLAEPYEEPLVHTTPEPITLHQVLARLAGRGVTAAAMEASSHGLAQRRLDGVRLAGAAFTNLTRDHLDYHSSAEDYAAAKLRLFSALLPAGAVAALNADDALFGAASAIAAARRLDMLAFGQRAEGARALRLLAQDCDLGGQTLRLAWDGAQRRVRLGLVGGFQGMNALAAAALAIGVGEAPAAVFDALEGLTGVRGRMELVARRANGAGIFVDYAHTPDAVATAVTALRAHTPARLHVVLGAGGDRDPGKRAPMGAAAAQADRAIITDDNPRNEDPAAIRAAVMSGVPDAARPRATEIGERAEAILAAVDGLAAGDALLIAGKGHETGQIVGAETLPFDDAEQARAAVLALDGEHGEIIER